MFGSYRRHRAGTVAELSPVLAEWNADEQGGAWTGDADLIWQMRQRLPIAEGMVVEVRDDYQRAHRQELQRTADDLGYTFAGSERRNAHLYLRYRRTP